MKGSPIPMKTTLESRSSLARSSVANRAACSKISSADKLRLKPICPVAQKVQPMAQPTWDEMQAVRLFVSYGISTDSMSWPSARRHKRFCVPSREICSSSICMEPKEISSFSRFRRESGKFLKLSKSEHPCTYTQSTICFARNFFSPHERMSSSSSLASIAYRLYFGLSTAESEATDVSVASGNDRDDLRSIDTRRAWTGALEMCLRGPKRMLAPSSGAADMSVRHRIM
mmetsp:Transcript_55979/g.121865  ORF Transcript_55979/g.121865 Transcript_55979/m.121865 type:complete len:229 (+) Transcript_55979:951-1637(+)